MKIRTWDKVKIISGKKKDKWVEAEVLAAFPDSNKIIVKWVNVAKRHVKKQWATPWQIIELEKPINVSNVMLVCPFTNKPTRIWFVKIEEKWKSKKYRYSKMALKDKKGAAKDYIIK